MKLLKSIFLIIIVTCLFTCSKDDHLQKVEEPSKNTTDNQEIFHVSTNGNDNNDGKTLDTAWKTLHKATATLTEGQTAIFEDGVYNENMKAIFEHSGSKGKPIIVKSRNKHGAKIIFLSDKDYKYRPLIHSPKIWIQNKSYIEINGFDISQPKRSNSTDPKENNNDYFIYLHGGNYKGKTGLPEVSNCSIIGNKVNECAEDGIKLYKVHHTLIQDNEISKVTHESVDMVDCHDITLDRNKLFEIGRIGLMSKGASKNIIYSNNVFKNKTNECSYAITLGGITGKRNSNYDMMGYEGYNHIAFNNIIIGKADEKDSHKIRIGISFFGSKDCYAFNNVIVGTQYAFEFKKVTTNNWDWEPIVDNPTIKNNILMDITTAAISRNHDPEKINISHNFFYNVPTKNLPYNGEDKNSITSSTSPIVAPYNLNDFRLTNNSPVIGKGIKISNSFKKSSGETYEIDLHNFDNKKRGDKWNIGTH